MLSAKCVPRWEFCPGLGEDACKHEASRFLWQCAERPLLCCQGKLRCPKEGGGAAFRCPMKRSGRAR